MIYLLRSIGSALLFLFFVSAAFAQSSDFNVRVALGDVTPPTTPTLLSATAVDPYQVDIDWTDSTDNFVVFGYVVFRDGVSIATTTQTSYSDVGLTASTTYEYEVQAFDPSFNYSTSSNALQVTTPNPPAPAPAATSTATESTAARVVLNDVVIEEGDTTARFTITTQRPARIELRWGRTTEYELGYVVNNRFVREHQTTVTDLEPGTTYEYEVIGYSQSGAAFVLEQGQFTTESYEAASAPMNVGRFWSVVDGSDVQLFWDLPPLSDLAYVRIVRSHYGYPTHVRDGSVVYQGLATSAQDDGVLDIYSPVYYTAFVVDTDGNVSSGAVLKVSKDQVGRVFENLPQTATSDGIDILDDKATTSEDIDVFAGEYRVPDISEIFIYQGEQRYVFTYPAVSLKNNQPFTISIPKEAVSNTLKSIMVQVVDPTDTRNVYAYILKINADQSAYEAVIAPLSLVGNSRIVVAIYDFESKLVSTYRKNIIFVQGEEGKKAVLFPDLFLEYPLITFAILMFPLLWILFLLLRLRLREDKHR